MADVSLFGLDPAGHHGTSLLLHAAAATLFLLGLRAMGGPRWAALAAALLFAVHPQRVESVAWVAERKDVLAGLFWFAGILAWIRYARRPTTGRYLPVVMALAGGLASKPTAVTLPLVLLVLDWWPLGRLGPAGRGMKGPGAALVEKVPLLALSAAAGLVTFLVQRTWGAMQSPADFPLPDRLANGVLALGSYLGKTVWPASLAALYPHRSLAASLPGVLASATLLGVLGWLGFRTRQRLPWIGAGLAWFAVALAPVLGLVQVGEQGMADRYTYLPAAGACLAVVWTFVAVLEGRPAWRRVSWILGGAVILLLAGTTWRQIGYWGSGESLFRHARAVTGPNPVAHRSLGVILHREGRFPEAVAEFRSALLIRPADPAALQFLGNALAAWGRLPEAAEAYRRALSLRPRDVTSRNNLGMTLLRMGRADEAAEEFRRALAIAPGFPQARANLEAAQRRRTATPHLR
jgi:hypothetical protein